MGLGLRTNNFDSLDVLPRYSTMRTVFLFLLVGCLTSCENQTDTARSMNDPGVPIQTLIDSIENHGSVGALYSLEVASLDYRPGEFISTFLIMADKYDNASACKYVYYNILFMNNVPVIDDSENGIFKLDSLNTDEREMAIKYLVKADSLGDNEAKEHLLEYRKIGLIK
jgi:hypothetical protein